MNVNILDESVIIICFGSSFDVVLLNYVIMGKVFLKVRNFFVLGYFWKVINLFD